MANGYHIVLETCDASNASIPPMADNLEQFFRKSKIPRYQNSMAADA